MVELMLNADNINKNSWYHHVNHHVNHQVNQHVNKSDHLLVKNQQFPSYDTCQNMMEVAKYFDDPDQNGLCCEFGEMTKDEARKLLNQLSLELCPDFDGEKTIDTSKFNIPNQKMADFLRLLCYISLDYTQFGEIFYPYAKATTPSNYVPVPDKCVIISETQEAPNNELQSDCDKSDDSLMDDLVNDENKLSDDETDETDETEINQGMD